MSLRLFIIRHGETEWSVSGQHTGRADIKLTENGKVEATRIGQQIRDIDFSHVLVSPLERAKQTCEMAGLSKLAMIDLDLAEWDNGDYQGKTPHEILATRPDWNLFRDGCPNGESTLQIANRVDRLIRSLNEFDGDVALFTHGHLGRVLAARWIGLSVEFGQHFLLDTASLSILCYQHNESDKPAISLWNYRTMEFFESKSEESRDTRIQLDASLWKRRALERWENEGGEVLGPLVSLLPITVEPAV
jgi:broad specificity phosphatase PhoE